MSKTIYAVTRSVEYEDSITYFYCESEEDAEAFCAIEKALNDEGDVYFSIKAVNVFAHDEARKKIEHNAAILAEVLANEDGDAWDDDEGDQ